MEILSEDDAALKARFDIVWGNLLRNQRIKPAVNYVDRTAVKNTQRDRRDYALANTYNIVDGEACRRSLQEFFQDIQRPRITDYYIEMRRRWTEVFGYAIIRNKTNKRLMGFASKRDLTKYDDHEPAHCSFLIPLFHYIQKGIQFAVVPPKTTPHEIQDTSIYESEKMQTASEKWLRQGSAAISPTVQGSSAISHRGQGSAAISPTVQGIIHTAFRNLGTSEPGSSGITHIMPFLLRALIEGAYISYKEIHLRGETVTAFKIQDEAVVGEVFRYVFFRPSTREIHTFRTEGTGAFWAMYLERQSKLWSRSLCAMIFNTPSSDLEGANPPSFYYAVRADNLTKLYCWDATRLKPCHFVLPLPPFIKKDVVFVGYNRALLEMDGGISSQVLPGVVNRETHVNYIWNELNPLIADGYFYGIR
jgi:hypothetical protein